MKPLKIIAYLTGEGRTALEALDVRSDLNINYLANAAFILFERMTRPKTDANEMLESAVAAIKTTIVGVPFATFSAHQGSTDGAKPEWDEDVGVEHPELLSIGCMTFRFEDGTLTMTTDIEPERVRAFAEDVVRAFENAPCATCGVKKNAHHVCDSCVCTACPQKPGGGDECPLGYRAP